jgi:ribosomal peptide maturation radical SAM protein 1
MRIALINMPFASLAMPSLALTQLSSVLGERFGSRVRVETHYLNMEFARYLGDRSLYSHALGGAGFMTGFGDWFFRASAFPGAEDNTDAYLSRFYFEDDDATRAIREAIAAKRPGVDGFLDELIAARDLAGADIVGFTTLFAQTAASFAMARRLKLANPGLCAVVGGAACEGGMGQEFVRKVPQIDYVFSGCALASFPAFVDRRLVGRPEDCESIAGVFSRANAARWRTEKETRSGAPPAPDSVRLLGEEPDIGACVPLDYQPFLDALDVAFPEQAVKPVLLFETSRGCSWAEHNPCSFCGLNGLCLTYRSMTPEQALAYLRSLFRWVPRCSSFIAVDTIMPPEYPAEVFPRLGAPPGMKMMYEVRPVLDETQLVALADAGVASIQPGIEALSTSTLRLMRKGVSAFQNLRFLKACSRYPISLDWNLLIGSPREPEATCEKYLRDIPRLFHLPPPSGVYPINFARHSRYFEEADSFGLDLRPQDFYALTFPFGEDSVRNVAYHFVDRNADTARLDRWLDALSGPVAHWRSRWKGSDGKPQARLCLVEEDAGTSYVYDSRSGEEIEHRLGPFALDVLAGLDRPRNLRDVRREVLGTTAGDVEETLADLRARGLLFEEDGRMLSLVTG